MHEHRWQEAIKQINTESLQLEQSLDPLVRRRTGSYYTSLDLAIPMVQELIGSLPEEKRRALHTLTFLEPCVGTGNFVFAYIMLASEGLSAGHIVELLNNIYVCDINAQALYSYKTTLRSFVQKHFGLRLAPDYFKNHVGDGVLFDVTAASPEYIPLSAAFGTGAPERFDIVMTNPPYKNLKAELNHYASPAEKRIDTVRYAYVSQQAKKLLPLSAAGTLNLYKLFVEEIVERYAAPDALVSLLVPNSLLTDKTCEQLRAQIVRSYHVASVKNIPENNRFVQAHQALSAVLIDKNSGPDDTRLTNICTSYTTTTEEVASVYIREVATASNGYTILALSQHELAIVQKMMAHPQLKTLPCIVNLRGELDVTADKAAISSTETPYRLLRGRNIGYYRTQPAPGGHYAYATEVFVKRSAKRAYIEAERLACQQISNIAKERRLAFTKVAPFSVLANSCNFIAVTPNEYGIDAHYLLGLLNSKLMNWFFKLHSSNNHINNYEIGNFPVPIHGQGIQRISRLAAQLDGGANTAILDEIDTIVSELFGIGTDNAGSVLQHTHAEKDIYVRALADMRHMVPHLQPDDIKNLLTGLQTLEATLLKYAPALPGFDKKVIAGMLEKYQKLMGGVVLNHTTFKLSDLDLEMIKPIPQGGNWKHIPPETVSKSRRLVRITETGGRTTLYGRLQYDKPSYTITTYFNRPGNGTYVHPTHDRVLSVREAARLQAFSDDYYFYGNKTQLLKQVGNAVPTLLAYQIGRKITDALGAAVRSVDLFCGAGGLTSGLKRAGIATVLCTDFDEASCVTIKINNPETEVILGDITDDSVRSTIIEHTKRHAVDIVCGGPPCQGFSMAGYRDERDPRNQLFKEFVAVVREARPKIVLFENVEGIMTFKGGETYQAIHQLFAELGYQTEGRLLKIDKYGVPQRRKRVIILCTRNDTGIDPASLYPAEITAGDDSKVTVADALHDLEAVECSASACYNPALPGALSAYNRLLTGTMTAEDFLASLPGSGSNHPTREQLTLLGTE